MIFWDTETTGLIKNSALMLHMQPHIIEIGCVKDTGESFHSLINPGIPLEAKITEITGLDDAKLKNAPPFRKVLPDLIDFFLGEDTMVAHNMPFDLGMLLFELRRENHEHRFPYPATHIDTVQIAKVHYAGKYMKLQALYKDLIGPYEQKHRALDDAIDLQEVYDALMLKA